MSVSETSEVLLPCKQQGCSGQLQNLDVRRARALVEYWLAHDESDKISADCSACGKPSYYTYDEIINAMPPAWRPRPLGPSEGWALLLIEIPTAEHLTDKYLFGERLLVNFSSHDSQRWLGILLSNSGMAPSLEPGSEIGGIYLSSTAVVTTWLAQGKPQPIPIESPKPGTQDIGCFFIPKTAPDTLLAANLFCTNSSCSHIFGHNYSELKRIWEERAIVGWFWGSHFITLTCPKCQTARIVDKTCIDSLYKL